MPEISFLKPVQNEQADELVKLCPMKVFDIEDLGDGDRQARVARPRDCTMCRECVRDVKWQDKVKLARVKNHFIFSVESAGQLPAKDIFSEAVKVMIEKLNTLERELENIRTGANSTA
jgi:DNA-directed RNA polymerase I and III subunit RPAC1